VLTVVLGESPANALGTSQLAALENVVDTVSQTDDVRVLAFSGNRRFFSAGVDISLISENSGLPDGPQRMVAFISRLHDVFHKIESLPLPTVAIMEGSALGGGLELALACDFRVASTEAKYGLPEIKLGLLPGAGGTQRLPRLVGRAVALRMILRGELLSGQEAQQYGVVQWALPPSEVATWGQELSQEMARFSAFSLQAIKECVSAAEDPQQDGYALELAATSSLMSDVQVRDQLVAFLDKRTKSERGH
jgi:enoyl-CoA hydratase